MKTAEEWEKHLDTSGESPFPRASLEKDRWDLISFKEFIEQIQLRRLQSGND